MQGSDIKRCVNWKDEDRRLKPISADLLLENRALKDVIAKSFAASGEARAGCCITSEHGLSERRAWVAIGLERSVYHYQPRPNAYRPIVKLLFASTSYLKIAGRIK